jgi:hypothetical protein
MKIPHHSGKSWAMWWGLSFGLAFLAAATLSFSITFNVAQKPEHSLASVR